MLSPRSRGKGSRRRPGRDGGRGKGQNIAWRKQAMHAVDVLQLAPDEIAEITYRFRFSRSPAESIYLFDQRIAGTGVPYEAELHGIDFTIRVPASAKALVKAIIVQIKDQ